jgi:hypothetical protein
MTPGYNPRPRFHAEMERASRRADSLMDQTGSPIPWTVRAAALIQLLDRGHGKAFQSQIKAC